MLPSPQLMTDMNYPLVPGGLYKALMRARGYGVPLLVTETGAATRDEGVRALAIDSYFKQARCAMCGAGVVPAESVLVCRRSAGVPAACCQHGMGECGGGGPPLNALRPLAGSGCWLLQCVEGCLALQARPPNSSQPGLLHPAAQVSRPLPGPAGAARAARRLRRPRLLLLDAA
jgi:hypothetical protein